MRNGQQKRPINTTTMLTGQQLQNIKLKERRINNTPFLLYHNIKRLI